MYLSNNEKEIPTQWEHDPGLQNNRGMTVAMFLTNHGKEIPTQWEHDPAV